MQQFSCETKIYFGQNTSLEIFKLVENFSFKNIGFIIDENVFLNKQVQGIIKSFTAAGFSAVILKSRSNEEPDYDYLDKTTDFFKGKRIDCIIGIGGGSACDLAKGVGVLLKNPGKGIDYRGFNKVEFPGTPVILVPTTAGTGTEVTKTAVFTDKKEIKKLGINGKNVGAFFSVLDPLVLIDAPDKVKISAGLDALVHAIEAFACNNSTLMTKIIGKDAFGLIFINLGKAVKNKNNIEAHEKLFLGSYLAGVAMYNAGGGPSSGISYPLGVHFKVPHGIAGGIFLPHVLRFNVEKGFFDYWELLERISPSNSDSIKEKATRFVERFQQFYDDIGAPQKLNPYGVRKADIDFLVRLTMEQRSENLKLNPIKFSEADIKNLLENVID